MTSFDHKLSNISKDLCETYTQKITEALFKAPREKKRHSEEPNNNNNNNQQPSNNSNNQEPSNNQETNNNQEPNNNQETNNNQESSCQEPNNNNNSHEPSNVKNIEEKTSQENERKVTVEFDWDSFRDLFLSLINEGAEEVIDTILESLVSKDCAISLLSTLLEHCKPPSTDHQQGISKSKHELIRGFLQQGLTKYVIKYSEDPNEWGYYKNGVLCDVVEIDVTDNEEINWIFRDVTQNIEHCTDMQQFAVNNYYIPEFQQRIKNAFLYEIKLTVDWASIDYAAQDYAKAVYAIYHEHSAFVLCQILEAFEYIASYEEEDLVDAIAIGITCVNISLQPGQDSTRKDFDIDDKAQSLTLRLCLEADEFTGVFRRKDLVPIIKVAGLYNTAATKLYKMDLLSAAACTYKVPRGDLSIVKDILGRANLNWWTATVRDLEAIEGCRKFIEQYYKKRIQKWNQQEQQQRAVGADSSDQSPTHSDVQQQMQVQQQLQQINGSSDEEDLLQSIEDFEQIIKAWHVIKFNKRGMHQERYFVLTNKAYWTFKYDFASGKNKTGGVDDKHFKRHDLCDFCVADIGNLEQTNEFAVQALKVFTYEKRKKDMFGNDWSEVKTGEKKGKLSMELRKSLTVTKGNTGDEYQMFALIAEQLSGKRNNADVGVRNKLKKPNRERPSTEGCYSSIFLPCGQLEADTITEILKEIAWCIYAAAVSRQKQRGQTHEPFLNQVMTIPKKNLAAKVYNMLNVGMDKKNKVKTSKASTNSAIDSNHSERSAMPKIEVMKKHNPAASNGKVVKGILKPPRVYSDNPTDSASDQSKSKKHITFKPQVHVFYTGDDEDGENSSNQFFAISQNVEEADE